MSEAMGVSKGGSGKNPCGQGVNSKSVAGSNKTSRGVGKKLAIVFILALVFNFAWEYLHSALYAHYQSGPVTTLVLMKAALCDAVFIVLLGLLFLRVKFFHRRVWLSLIIGFVAAVFVERYALQSGMWAYTETMPVIPFIKAGLTPTVQLPILSYAILKLVGMQKGPET